MGDMSDWVNDDLPGDDPWEEEREAFENEQLTFDDIDAILAEEYANQRVPQHAHDYEDDDPDQ